ncbi:hypothetical protein Poly24_16630 [Rosistilla carotiformis]|uniref:Tetratricopeptide repeat protein n=1 Tax=Rosistilla carotiformis TaxID=2528017 RepID=A0A518JQZ0_9BACT|nr:hypothetical protein [Rosistilla carotiformis]QDV67957.1 hypothetical protein Poly24_16630 [Rosistilla carotiformis]
MNSKLPAAKARKITLLAALLTSQSVIAADRLDDWSSPRPIKYGISGAYEGRHESGATRSTSPSVPTPPLQPPISDRTSGPRPPQPPVMSDAVSPPLSTTGGGLFPAAEPMRPEHIGQPQPSANAVYATASERSQRPLATVSTPPAPTSQYEPSESTSMHFASVQPTQSVLAADSLMTHDRPSQSVLEVAALPAKPLDGYVALDPSPPSLQLQPDVSSIYPAYQTSVAAEKQPMLPVPVVETKTVSNWQLGRLASQKIEHAEELLTRQSPMTARQEAIEALHLIAQSTDETTRSSDGTEALTQALTAIREASDFLGRFGVVDATAMQRLVDSHSTRVLKRCDLEHVTSLRAADVYYEFARGRFVDAVAGWAPASRALTIVAKTEPLTSDVGDSNLSAAQVCCLRAAIACDPDNATAANELGHELLALGMFDEARWALEHSYAKRPSTAALQNLAELHRVTGNMELAQACATNLAVLQSQQPRVAQVVQLTPSQFAQMSPQVMTADTGGASAGDPSQRSNVQTSQVATQPQGRVASTFDRVKGIFR